MTSETRPSIKNINKPKAASAAIVGIPGYVGTMNLIGNWLASPNAPEWAVNAFQGHGHIWISVIVAGALAAAAAYRTKDTSEEPTKWKQRREAKEDARLDAALERRNGNGGAP